MPEQEAVEADPPAPRGEVFDDSESGSAPARRRSTKAPFAPAAPVAATPVARAQGTQLAYTGTEAWLMGLLGFGMALAGAGLFLVTAEPARPR